MAIEAKPKANFALNQNLPTVEKPRPAFEKGDIVQIYLDPITRKDLEGEAELIKLLGGTYYNEFWEIKFCNDGQSAYRWIHKNQNILSTRVA